VIEQDARFRPRVLGTGWAVLLMSKHTVNRVLDAVAESLGGRVEPDGK
jgi:hypothetical protein